MEMLEDILKLKTALPAVVDLLHCCCQNLIKIYTKELDESGGQGKTASLELPTPPPHFSRPLRRKAYRHTSWKTIRSGVSFVTNASISGQSLVIRGIPPFTLKVTIFLGPFQEGGGGEWSSLLLAPGDAASSLARGRLLGGEEDPPPPASGVLLAVAVCSSPPSPPAARLEVVISDISLSVSLANGVKDTSVAYVLL